MVKEVVVKEVTVVVAIKNNESYCHTNDRTHRDDHTSATFQHPREGHVTTATLSNRQGGPIATVETNDSEGRTRQLRLIIL